uniref:RNA-directed DNA polymerase n=1 Tax=Strigamia maritima TaxID=126957 RepID=T1IZA1_STRMM
MRRLFEEIRKSKLTLKLNKCHFLCSEVNFLGLRDWLEAAQESDPECKSIQEALLGGDVDEPMKQKMAKFVLKNRHVCFLLKEKEKNGTRTLMYLPKSIRRQTTQEIHESYAHPAVDGTIDAILKRFWFPRMRKFVKGLIGSCVNCLMFKEPGGRRPGALNLIIREKIPWHTVHLDHVGPLPRSNGFRHVLVATCNYSKITFLRAVRSTSAIETCKKLRELCAKMWIPTRIITDRGTAFKNSLFTELCEKLEIKHILTSTENPRANGQVERILCQCWRDIRRKMTEAIGRNF